MSKPIIIILTSTIISLYLQWYLLHTYKLCFMFFFTNYMLDLAHCYYYLGDTFLLNLILKKTFLALLYSIFFSTVKQIPSRTNY